MSNTSYRIIAYHDDAPGLYLVSPETIDSLEASDQAIKMAQVLDTRQGILFPPTPIISLCAHDPWQYYEGDQSILADLLKQVRPFEDSEDEEL